MGTTAQDNPFRETAWDQRLDMMLDDLKTTVGKDGGSKQSCRRDLFPAFDDNHLQNSESTFLDIFRSTSRNESRISNRSGVEDGGQMKHYHKEYTSPDNRSKMVSDQYEYEEGDPSKNFHKKLLKSTYKNYKVTGELSSDLDSLRRGPDPALMDSCKTDTKVVTASQTVANKLVDALSTIDNTNHYVAKSYLTNKSKCGYDANDSEYFTEPKGGEVRNIVWRNRFEKTYETQDGTPSMTIEDESRRRRQKEHYERTSSSHLVNSYSPPRGPPVAPRQLQLQYAVYYPNVSPGNQSWTDPIPMPTPPQISPRGEPGVAYVYSYNENKSQLRNIPTVSYTTIPAEGGRSPTPSSSQPFVNHYSYHYHLPPGEDLPDDLPKPPTTFPPGRNLTYDYKKQMTKTTYDNSTETSDLTNLLHRHQPLEILENKDISGNRDVSVTINKFTTNSSPNGPTTSTPFRNYSDRSRSVSPERPYGRTATHHSHTTHSHSDSTDRLRKPHHHGLPFPDTSPITHADGSKIPTRVDDLMTTISGSEYHSNRFPTANGPRSPVEPEVVAITKVTPKNPEVNFDEDDHRVDIKKSEMKNVAGPPVYYPPGHKQLFDESMHTMTLKENGRRGKAKWRMEQSAKMKEKSSSGGSDKKVGMVPVCLPLCCGAACVIM